ncbi:MAG: GNAT family N-acetyltransferase [Anaerolineae bacterium]|nr:GNAT family N-acetyltransferase [Anaerolineae bacterium]NUQ06039.1 GNAT family N-acetyltransferase [Anaerolineae bacterium]
MEVYEYDEVDPLAVLHLNLLCLGFPLTPERVAILREQDPRSFPFFAIYARHGGVVTGQVGVFRLPVVSVQGVEEVGGIWAVCIHPTSAYRGTASRLLDEAHSRMRAAGMRFSTLAADRQRMDHALYKKYGYEDVHAISSAIIASGALPHGTDLRAEQSGRERLSTADWLFEQISRNHLGFARRHLPFFSLLDQSEALSGQDLWLLWKNGQPVGYASAVASKSILKIADLLLFEGVDPVAAVAAIARELKVSYVCIRTDRSAHINAYLQAGFRLVVQDWGAFMVRPLVDGVCADDFRRLFAVGTDRFLISYLDVTQAAAGG